MKQLFKWIGLLSLAAIFLAPFAYFFDFVSDSVLLTVVLIATIVWYGTALIWMGQPEAPTLEDDPLL